MPPYDPRAFMKLMLWSISFLLICTFLFASEVTTKDKVIEVLEKIEQVEKDGDKVYWNKITEVKPKDAADQYCYVKVIIKESDNKIIKEEILECADGRSRVDAPTYWQLFAEFYYVDIYTPEYCRKYSRSGHAFKTPGKVCLTKNGEWEVK
tara:strand:- start:27 stop:479 length:453 start_codon:yes stop_codon:yes gene_type:complete